MSKVQPLFNRIKQMLGFAWKECRAPYFVGIPAQMAFYLFMSVLPLIILISQLLGLFSLSLEEIEAWANINISSEGLQLIGSMLTGTPSGLGNVFLMVTAIWGASKSQYSFITISDRILSGGAYVGRGFLRERLRSIFSTIIMLLCFCSALLILIYAPAVLRLLFGKTKAMKIGSSIWMHLRWLVVLSLYFLVILFVYFSTAGRGAVLMSVLPGTVFTACGFLLASGVFRLYVRFSASRDILYGALSNIVVLLMWFWLMSWILILGVVVNKAWDKTSTAPRYKINENYRS